jgi:hypothetical protein
MDAADTSISRHLGNGEVLTADHTQASSLHTDEEPYPIPCLVSLLCLFEGFMSHKRRGCQSQNGASRQQYRVSSTHPLPSFLRANQYNKSPPFQRFKIFLLPKPRPASVCRKVAGRRASSWCDDLTLALGPDNLCTRTSLCRLE